MEHKLIVDSCCELIPELEESLGAQAVPLSMLVDGVTYVDDQNLDVNEFLAAMKKSRKGPKSSCPSPQAYADKLRRCMNTFVVTLSSKLSGSYNSAMIAKGLVEHEEPEKKIHVFDSLSASAGEIAVGLKIKECIDQKLDFDSIVVKVTDFIDNMKTFLILESLDTVIKAGRMGMVTGHLATVLSMRPIMTAHMGNIKLHEKVRGSDKAFARLVEIIGECCTNFKEHTLVITHCNNEKQANFIKEEAEKRYNFKDIKVVPKRGLSSMYANEGGVIIAF